MAKETNKKSEKKVDKVKDLWLEIKEANDQIQTRQIKDRGGQVKEYAEVKERVIAFRRVHPLGQIITDLTFSENYVNCEAMVFDENGVMLAKGHSREYLKTAFAIEKSETSAIGRALGFCGFGISTSIASAEDMEEVEKPSEIFDERPIQDILNDFNKRFTKQEQIDLFNALHIVEPIKMGSKLMSVLNEWKDEKHSAK